MDLAEFVRERAALRCVSDKRILQAIAQRVVTGGPVDVGRDARADATRAPANHVDVGPGHAEVGAGACRVRGLVEGWSFAHAADVGPWSHWVVGLAGKAGRRHRAR